MVLSSKFPDVVLDKEPVGQLYLRRLRQFGDRVAIVDADDDADVGRHYTYADLERITRHLAAALHSSSSCGLASGDVVGVCALNHLELPALMFATACCGAVYSPINPAYTGAEIVKLFQISKPKIVFASAEFLPKLQEVAAKITSIKEIVVMGGGGGGVGVMRASSFDEFVKRGRDQDFPSNVVIDPQADTCMLPFSSGTTGLAKGVMLSHNYVHAVTQLSSLYLKLAKNAVSVLCVPNFHIFGLVKYLSIFRAGAKMISMRKFTTLHNLLATVEKYKVTDLSMVPPLLLGISNLPDLDRYDLTSIKDILCGAAPLPESVSHDIERKLNAKVCQAWGLTEFLPATMAFSNTTPATSVGSLVSNTALKIIDPDTSKELGVNERGEIWLKGSQMMTGYYNRPEATRACIDAEGWFHTGDIGYYDENEFVYIVDRLKELIKYKGFQVAPAELEEVLVQHADIADAAVIGVPDERAGELPKAFIVRKSEQLTKQDVHDYLKGEISHFKYLRGGITFCEQIPKSPSGKILRRLLRDTTSKL